MKRMKVFDIHEFPAEFQDEIAKKQNHCEGACSWYPGDGYFKPISEVRNKNNILELKDHTPGYVYEIGDDPIGDWLMENHGIKLVEEVLIK